MVPTSALVVAGGPGLVVLAYAPSVARAALASTSGITGPVRDLAAWVNAPVVTISGPAVPGVNGAPPCVDAIAYTDDVIDHRERIVLVTDSPSTDQIVVEGRLAEVEPVIDGRYVTIATTYDDEHSAANLVTSSTGMPEGSTSTPAPDPDLGRARPVPPRPAPDPAPRMIAVPLYVDLGHMVVVRSPSTPICPRSTT